MKKQLILLSLLLLSHNPSYAQEKVYNPNGYFDIDGICIGDTVTDSLLRSHFGEPLKVEHQSDDYDDYFIVYYFEGIRIDLYSSMKIAHFSMTSSNYAFMTTYDIGEGVHIGDSLKTLTDSGYPFKKFIEHPSPNPTKSADGVKEYLFMLSHQGIETDDFFVVLVNNGIITEIETNFPI